MASTSHDELSNLRIIVEEDKKIIAAARWMPRVELACCDKRCHLLGGHQTATNSIMVWCTCNLPDEAHPDSSRLMALDAWVVEHCRGEDLESYEEDEGEAEDESDGLERLDKLVLEEAKVVRAGPNVLHRQIPLRQLLSSALVAQGGNKELKGVGCWVYWYDQDIPAPESEGMGVTWFPGPLTDPQRGLWYRAKILRCNTSTGAVKIRYEVDSSEDSMYLLVAFTHFDDEPPTRGEQPEVLPYMERVRYLGLSQSAVRGAAAAGTAGNAAAKAPGKRAADTSAPQPPASAPAAAAPAAKPPADKPKPKPAAKAGAVERPSAAIAAAAAAKSDAAMNKEGRQQQQQQQKHQEQKQQKPAGTPAAVPQPQPPKPKALHVKRPSSPPAPPPALPPEAAAKSGGGIGGPAAAAAAAAPAARQGTLPPAKRPRHEFEALVLAATTPNGGPGAAPAPSTAAAAAGLRAPFSESAWSALEAAAQRRRGYQGLLCGRREQAPIFVFNEVDSETLPEFEYLTGPDFESRLQQDLATASRRHPAVGAAMEELRELCGAAKPRWGDPCGLQYHRAVRQRQMDEQRREEEERRRAAPAGPAAGRGPLAEAPPALPLPEEDSYGADGRLLATRPLGLHECSLACTSPRCRGNMQVVSGLRRPLEVFRTADRRWGLRCAQALEPGDFVAALTGRLVAAAAVAEEVAAVGGRPPAAPGVVLLNHFFDLWETAFFRGLAWCERHLRLWQLPPNPLSHALNATAAAAGSNPAAATPDADPARPAVRRLSPMLALDTRAAGNVARFVRHWTQDGGGGGGGSAGAASLGPSLVAQPVLAGGCRSPLLYHVALFAARRVGAMEELSCDFGGMALGGQGPGGLAGPAR